MPTRLPLQCLQITLEKVYREALDLLSKMPQIVAEIGIASVEEIESDRALEGHDPDRADVATDGGDRR